jgi:hypothetical protein
MGKGSRRNEQKRNASATAGAKGREEQARAKLKEYESIPYALRSQEFSEEIKRLRGILSKAIHAGRKSETHSRRGKAGRK